MEAGEGANESNMQMRSSSTALILAHRQSLFLPLFTLLCILLSPRCLFAASIRSAFHSRWSCSAAGNPTHCLFSLFLSPIRHENARLFAVAAQIEGKIVLSASTNTLLLRRSLRTRAKGSYFSRAPTDNYYHLKLVGSISTTVHESMFSFCHLSP